MCVYLFFIWWNANETVLSSEILITHSLISLSRQTKMLRTILIVWFFFQLKWSWKWFFLHFNKKKNFQPQRNELTLKHLKRLKKREEIGAILSKRSYRLLGRKLITKPIHVNRWELIANNLSMRWRVFETRSLNWHAHSADLLTFCGAAVAVAAVKGTSHTLIHSHAKHSTIKIVRYGM